MIEPNQSIRYFRSSKINQMEKTYDQKKKKQSSKEKHPPAENREEPKEQNDANGLDFYA